MAHRNLTNLRVGGISATMQTLYLLGLILLVFVVPSWELRTLVEEREYLCDFYRYTNGPQWIYSNLTDNSSVWNCSVESTSDPCVDLWSGLTCSCDLDDCTVTSLVLYNMSLNSSGHNYLPTVRLDNLTVFDLEYNDHLTTNLPTFTSKKLIHVNLRFARCHGTIPSSYSDLKNLQVLTISGNNYITGQLPSFLGELTDLHWLTVSSNRMNGTIPTEIGKLKKMSRFSIFSNYFTGSVPKEIFEFEYLRSFRIYNNSLTGRIPSTLSTSYLTFFELQNNKLSGPIPSIIGEARNLSSFTANDNQFTGTLPSTLSKLVYLVDFYIQNNKLHGVIPPDLHKMSSLEDFVLAGNNFRGSLDYVFRAPLPALRIVDISNNQLHGRLPAVLFNSTSLEYFVSSVNCFRDEIPDSICTATNLRYLSLFALASADRYVLHI